MKKNYVKPAIAVEEILLENAAMMNPASGPGTSFGGDGGGEEEADANVKRGWGNLWN